MSESEYIENCDGIHSLAALNEKIKFNTEPVEFSRHVMVSSGGRVDVVSQ